MMRFVLIFAPIFVASLGQLTLKAGMNQVGKVGFTFGELIKMFFNPLVLLGLFFYFSSAVVWLVVLSREKLSFVYPLVAASYVFTMILTRLFLKEPIPS